MGKNSKARRAARANQRRRANSRPGGPGRPPPGAAFGFGATSPPNAPLPPRPIDLWDELTRSHSPRRRSDVAAQILRAGPGGTAGAGEWLVRQVAMLWNRGWQPREVVRHARRLTSKRSARLIELAIHADHATRGGQQLDPLWSEQVRALGGRETSLRQDWVAVWAYEVSLAGPEMVRAILEVMRSVLNVPPLEELIAPPGGSPGGRPMGVGSVTADPMLERVRKLLAKAESTEFDAEAEALSAKAQQLMTQHAIDSAAVAGDHTTKPNPRMIRVPIDAPYADAKSYLLQVVAQANRCRAVFRSGLALSSIIGMRDDLRGVEVLFTSLLVQAQHAMAHSSGAGQAGSRARSQGYRSAFLQGFAHRIGERLEAANQATFVAAAEGGSNSDFLPVLAAQGEAVDELFDELYAETTKSSRVRGGYDPLGAREGEQAANRARLDAGEVTA